MMIAYPFLLMLLKYLRKRMRELVWFMSTLAKLGSLAYRLTTTKKTSQLSILYIQIITRAFIHRNVEPLHRAGADFVMSQDHMGANTIFNLLNRAEILMVTEGLDVFSQKTPKSLIGVKLRESKITEKTGCSLVAIKGDQGTIITPSADHQFSENGEIILIGDEAAEKSFESKFCST